MTYAILLLVLAIILILMEIFIPSFGLLGVMAAIAAAFSLVMAFRIDDRTGIVFVGIMAVAIPVSIIYGLKMFPHTPIGKKLILTKVPDTVEDRGVAGIADEDYSVLIDKRGIAASMLRPSGIVEIDDIRYSAISKGEMIDANTSVVVIEVEGNNIVVEEIEA